MEVRKALNLSANAFKEYGQSEGQSSLYQVFNDFKEFRLSDSEARQALEDCHDTHTEGESDKSDESLPMDAIDAQVTISELQQQLRKLKKRQRQVTALEAAPGPLDDAQKEKIKTASGLGEAIQALEEQLQQLQCT